MNADFYLKRELKNVLEHGRVRSPSRHVHFHSHIEIYVVHSGEIEIIINDRRQVLSSGEISVAFSYDSHGYRTLSNSEAEYLIVPLSYCKDALHLFENKKNNTPFINDKETYETVSVAMARLFDETNELMSRGLIYIILGAILKKVELSEAQAQQTSVLSAEMLIYISQNFADALTLVDLAKHFGYNPSYLSRSFKQTFGMPFCKYLSMIRLREAVLRLKDGERNVAKCALESGFGSVRSFYRAFGDEFGMTPTEYFKDGKKQ